MKGYRTKKIALPGGKVIEIVYFSEPATAGTEPVGATIDVRDDESPDDALDVLFTPDEDALDLHVCPSCESELVYPVSWEERAGDTWKIERRCPNCEWRHTGEYGQDDVELFDDALNDGTEDLLVSLRNFARANMEADIERLIDAIQRDRIEPMDF
ncbi:MAG: hypothetical protein AB7V62_17440 [Thermoleophilia bacterium]